MRKFVFLLWFALFAFISNSYSQNYYYLQNTGTSSDYNFQYTGTYVLNNSTAAGFPDTLSAHKAIPFNFNFYGSPVKSYRISDNGYITFDSAAIGSKPSNEGVPSLTAPKKSIFAFWDALVLTKPDANYRYAILNWTYGTAPNRVHVIQWFQMHAGNVGTTTTSLYTFAIRLYESGNINFDVVYDLYFKGTGTEAVTSGTTGCQNGDGTLGTMISTSPSTSYPTTITSGSGSTHMVYEFFYGTQPAYDLSVTAISMNDLASIGSNNPVTGVIRNLGSQAVNSFKINYSINNGTPVTATINSTIASGATYNFTATPWNPSTGAGLFHNIKVWGDNINGTNEDMLHANDTATKTIFVNMGISGKKRTLIEEFTTVPCGYCPDGHIVLEGILTNHSDVIGVCHHDGFGTDGMTISEHTTYASAFADGAPTAAVDRHRFPGDGGNIAISRNLWESAAVDRLSQPAPCKVQVYGTFNSSTRALDVTAKVDFVDYALPGDLRITLFVVENHVTGSGTNWDQHSYYYNTSGHPMYHVGVYNGSYAAVAGYDHKHVVRDVLSPVWGTSSIISANTAPSQSYTKNYTATLDATWKPNDVSLVVFVSKYNSDNNKKDILNSYKVTLNNLSSIPDALEPTTDQVQVNIYPNPVENIGIVDFSLNSKQQVSYSIYNTYGQMVYSGRNQNYASGNNTLYFDASKFESGVYIIKLTIGDQTISKVFVK